jgi:hypothetical protein
MDENQENDYRRFYFRTASGNSLLTGTATGKKETG